MPINRPYKRTCRPFVGGSYRTGNRSYITDLRFAQSPGHYVRAFLLILRDAQRLFDYIEPADTNLPCYSYRIHELLFRTCVEIEANCKAILSENGYAGGGNWSMKDYCKLEASHRLSGYLIRYPFWSGIKGERKPFAAWARKEQLSWYQAYNNAKHDRHAAFKDATFENLTDALAGLLAILSAQFHEVEFSSRDEVLVAAGHDEFWTGIGGYMRVRFPTGWLPEEHYEFSWENLRKEDEPFQNFNFAASEKSG